MNNLLIELLIGIILLSLIYSYPSLYNYLSISNEVNLIRNLNSDINYLALKTMISRETYIMDLFYPNDYRIRKIAIDSNIRKINYPKTMSYKNGNINKVYYSPNGMPSISGNFTLRGKNTDYKFIMRVAQRYHRLEKKKYAK